MQLHDQEIENFNLEIMSDYTHQRVEVLPVLLQSVSDSVINWIVCPKQTILMVLRDSNE